MLNYTLLTGLRLILVVSYPVFRLEVILMAYLRGDSLGLGR
jgi:hypothetical protein